MNVGLVKRRRAALALASAAALTGGVLGVAGPASAAATHAVIVQASPGVSGLVASLDCDDPVGPGAPYDDTAQMSSTGAVVFSGVPDGYECSADVNDNNYFGNYTYTTSATTTSTAINVTGAARTDFRCTNFGSMSGSLTVTSTVSAVLPPTENGSFTTTGLTYDWYRVDYVGGNPHYVNVQNSNPQHSSAQYTLTEADYGHQIEVDVDGTDANGDFANNFCGSAISAPVGRLGAPAPGRPGIRGVAKVGHRLAARTGTLVQLLRWKSKLDRAELS